MLAPFGLPELIARADRQLEALEAFRLEAVAESFDGRRERILPDVLHD